MNDRDQVDRAPDLQAANEALLRANAELRASRAALAASEARLRLALSAARMANWEWEAVGDRTTGSEGREALYGRPPGTLTTAAAVLEAVHPEDRARCAATITHAQERMEAGDEFDAVEFRVVHPDGRIRWLRSQGRVTERDPLTGKALRAAGVTFDITERREAEMRYRVLFDAAPFGVLVSDPATHRILDVNRCACEEYGYGREEFLRLSVTDIDALGDSDRLRERGRAHQIDADTREFEAQHRRRDNVLRDVLVRAKEVDLGGGRVSYGVHVDITARKAAEAALRQSEELLRVAMEAGGLGAWETDSETDHTRWCPRLAAMLGLPPVTMEMSLAEMEALIHPQDRAALLGAYRDAAATGGSYAVDFRIRRPDGEERWLRSWGRMLPDGGAPAHRMAGVCADVTDRRLAEERQVLLVREVDHRAKNVLAVVQAALRLTPRHDPVAYAGMVEGRVAALARAHTLLAESHWTGADLAALLRAELQPFLPGDGSRITLDGPAVIVSPQAAQAIGMAMHELATNASKYGALSAAGGRIALGWQVEEPAGALRLRWEETGGPSLAGPPLTRGFGTRVVDATLERQLGGQVRRDWRQQGLVLETTLPLGSIRPR
ncbi:PAS domain-containing protein [Roseicella aquatilis]|uniref:histidine kinase n=1 Tax=Roseicella aquatilis TaxID=2527868 RepID=A0A4R4DGA3_9PROT|nr:PAS domain-containing protein [Roseicella aquatilis]TCZ59851.1 PAS domain S-box protein [Roseicella aquatilis]